MDVMIDGDTITKILTHNPDPVVSTPNVINLSGRFLIPDLIDTHQHISNSPEKCLSNALLNGITALRDLGGDGAYLTELQEAVKRGELLAPDIYFSALMGGPELILKDTRVKLSTLEEYNLGSAPWMRLVDDTCDIVQIVIDARSFGVSGIKRSLRFRSQRLSNGI